MNIEIGHTWNAKRPPPREGWRLLGQWWMPFCTAGDRSRNPAAALSAPVLNTI